MASIKDVARVAGVSVSTVSHVINKTRFVSDSATQAVEKAIASLGYKPSYLARALKSKQTRTIGMLVTSSTNPFFAQVVSGVEEGCYRNGYSLILGNSGNLPGRQLSYLHTLVHKQIDALVIMTTNRDTDFQAELDKQISCPRVVLDSEPILNGCAIGDNSFVGGQLAAQHFLSLGHTKIGCLAGPNYHSRSNERFNGFQAALHSAGLEIDAKWVISGELTAKSGYLSAKKLLSYEERPTAIFAFNDLMASGAYRAIHEAGLSIPDDISIIGYDDIEIASFLVPALTTVQQPGFELGLQAAELLINNLEIGTKLPPQVRRTPQLIARDSTAKPATITTSRN